MTVAAPVAARRRRRPDRLLAHRRADGRAGDARPGRGRQRMTRRSGPPIGWSRARSWSSPGFALENADAPFLHEGLNLADIAHVLDLRRRKIIPAHAARELLALLLEIYPTDADDFPYDPQFGEPYNSRERFFVERARRRRRLAARGTSTARGGADRLAVVPAQPPARTGRRDRALGPRRNRAGGPAHHDVDARPDVPAAGPAVDVRPLRAVLRLSGAARRNAAARRVGLGQPQPGRRGMCEWHAAARRSRVHR